MKYISYLLILFFLLTNIVLASQNIEVNNKVISFNNIENYNLQSFTIADDRIIIVLVNYDNNAGIIKEYSLKNYKEIRSINIDSVGHANGITYNKNNKRLYILHADGDDTIYIYDSNTLEYIDKVRVNLPIRSIAYVEEEDNYLVRTYIMGYKLDNNFKLVSKMPFISNLVSNYDVARQDWTYYKGKLYYANWSWKRLGGDGANIIYVYNIKGKLLDTLFTKDNLGELEDIDFYDNKMVLGFNGYDDKVNFYLEDLVEINDIVIEDKEEIKEEIKDENNKQFYIYLLVIPTILFIFILTLFMIRKRKKAK